MGQWENNYSGKRRRYYGHASMKREPEVVQINPVLTESKAWGFINDGLLLEVDKDDAAKAADRVIELVRIGRQREHEDLRAIRRQKLKKKVKPVFGWGLVSTVVALALSGLSYGGYIVSTHNDNDYAGYGPTRAIEHGADAMRAWYGEARFPEMTYISRKRAKLVGSPAWLVTFRTKEGKTVCAYVWNGTGDEDPYKVKEGAACTT